MSAGAPRDGGLLPMLPGIALEDERISFTWPQLGDALNRLANALLALSAAEDGARVAIFAANCAEGMLAHLAALRAGLSSVPVSFHLTTSELEYILQAGDVKILFVGPETAEAGLSAAARVGFNHVIGWRCGGEVAIQHFSAVLAEASDAEPPSDMPPRPHLHFTSGTTGRPKAVETPPTMFPQAATVSALFQAFRAEQAALGPRSPTLIVSPLYHTGPMRSVRGLAGGTSAVVMSRFDAEGVLRTIQEKRIAGMMMVPTHFARLLALPEDVRARYDISSLIHVGHTGASCPVEVKQRMIDWFGPILLESYGATEAGSTNVISSAEWLKRPGSVGRAVSPYRTTIVDEAGSELGPNQEGLVYFQDNTGRGIIYHNDPDATKAAHIAPGTFTLGEIGYLDEDGYLFITDRFSDMVVSGGVNIYSAEIEKVLIEHPGVLDVAAIGVPSAAMGEEVKALVVPRDPARPPVDDDLDRFCRARLAGFKCPRSYERVADLGRNAMGKINKRALRAPYWEGARTIGG